MTKNYILTFLLAALGLSLNSCKQKQVDQNSDFAAYSIEAIEGTDLSVAKKYNGDLLLEEVYLKDGKPHGTWTIYFEQNHRIKDHKSYFNGLLNGYWLKFNNLGRVEQMEQYRNGLLHGELIKYYSGFPIEMENYRNGQPHGIFKKYYPNKVLQQEANYQNGKLNGLFRYYNDEGKLTLEYMYKDGEKVSGGIME